MWEPLYTQPKAMPFWVNTCIWVFRPNILSETKIYNKLFVPLRETMGFFIIVMCDSLPSPLPTGPLFRY